MKKSFAAMGTVVVLVSFFIVPAPASALMFIDYYTPMGKPYFSSHMEVLRHLNTPLNADLCVTPVEGLNDVRLRIDLTPNGDGSYGGTTTESYCGCSLEFHMWFYRWGNYAFVRILTSFNGVFFDDRNEIFILTSTSKLFN